MRTTQYQLFIKAAATGGPVLKQNYGADALVDVRDITTRTVVQLRAREVSPYRHNLLMDGKAFEILNVVSAG